MAYLISAVVLAALIMIIMFLRYRLSGNPVKTVDSFQRAIRALRPERNPRDRTG